MTTSWRFSINSVISYEPTLTTHSNNFDVWALSCILSIYLYLSIILISKLILGVKQIISQCPINGNIWTLMSELCFSSKNFKISIVRGSFLSHGETPIHISKALIRSPKIKICLINQKFSKISKKNSFVLYEPFLPVLWFWLRKWIRFEGQIWINSTDFNTFEIKGKKKDW